MKKKKNTRSGDGGAIDSGKTTIIMKRALLEKSNGLQPHNTMLG